LHPLQELQQSAEAQQIVAAFVIPATPSAITAIKTTALIAFIFFS
jgi:hypothetical protein